MLAEGWQPRQQQLEAGLQIWVLTAAGESC